MLINLEPEIVYWDNTCLNARNIEYCEAHDLFVIIHYAMGARELFRFGSAEETVAAVSKLEKAWAETYGH